MIILFFLFVLMFNRLLDQPIYHNYLILLLLNLIIIHMRYFSHFSPVGIKQVMTIGNNTNFAKYIISKNIFVEYTEFRMNKACMCV